MFVSSCTGACPCPPCFLRLPPSCVFGAARCHQEHGSVYPCPPAPVWGVQVRGCLPCVADWVAMVDDKFSLAPTSLVLEVTRKCSTSSSMSHFPTLALVAVAATLGAIAAQGPPQAQLLSVVCTEAVHVAAQGFANTVSGRDTTPSCQVGCWCRCPHMSATGCRTGVVQAFCRDMPPRWAHALHCLWRSALVPLLGPWMWEGGRGKRLGRLGKWWQRPAMSCVRRGAK